ncbi:MAG: hypothetical protein RJA70_4223 [Pseudomonadota bacterium]|jgi:Na+-transporting NADH:ubiquinone oxidoreductase subunit NqrA
MKQLEESGSWLALHGRPIVEIPLENQLTISVYVNMARTVVADPSEQDEVVAADFAHRRTDTMGGNTCKADFERGRGRFDYG